MNRINPVMDVLVLYDGNALDTEFVYQHVSAIARHSRHRVQFAAATFDRRADFPFEMFEAVIIHFSIRLPLDNVLAPDFAAKMMEFQGAKVALIQDEYDLPLRTSEVLRKLGVHAVFTTVPECDRECFYPRALLPGVDFRQCLTGYVPDDMPSVDTLAPISERPLWVGYRGRELPVWYGSLGQEKHQIGVRMKRECALHGIAHDIAWSEDKRIFGPAWFEFLGSCRVTLGTESGSNVVDRTGAIREQVRALQDGGMQLSRQDLYEKCVAPHDNEVRMNQISPKIFEAIATKTGLVLFEGEYSQVVRANEHFVPLRKDFSNLDDVFRKIGDAVYLQEMVDRTYRDIVESGRFGYGSFVSEIDACMSHYAPVISGSKRWTFGAVACAGDGWDWTARGSHLPVSRPIPYRVDPAFPTSYKPLLSGRARGLWLSVPENIRKVIISVLGPVIARLRAAKGR